MCLVDPGCGRELTQKRFQPLGEKKPSTDTGEPVVLAKQDPDLRSSGVPERGPSVSRRRERCSTEERELALVPGDQGVLQAEKRWAWGRALWPEGTSVGTHVPRLFSEITALPSNALYGVVGSLLESREA